MVAGRVRWRGDNVSDSVRRAAASAINELLGECVNDAKQNHPGWRNRTGNAEGSIRVIEPANPQSTTGRWGSVGVNYMRTLEYKRGRALQSAADRQYPTLGERIQRRLSGGGA